MKNFLIIHGYSADNIGDGLLVYEAISLIKEAYLNPEITVLCSYPESFNKIDNVSYIRSKPHVWGYNLQYLKTLINMKSFDAIIGVGGGYLRTGGFKESIGTFLTHFPQLLFASFSGNKALYLPQSIGPLGFWLGWLYKFLLSNLKIVYLRDNRSVEELKISNMIRVPDMAILKISDSYNNQKYNFTTDLYSDKPVFSVRKVKGRIPSQFFKLVEKFKTYDSYIQSSVGGNNDLEVSNLLKPRKILSKNEMMQDEGIRVIVAVRLHAALMAIERGHFVVHLSYERKGFSAFSDLGLEDYVFNVNNFDVEDVYLKVNQLLTNENIRKKYKKKILDNIPSLNSNKDGILKSIKDL